MKNSLPSHNRYTNSEETTLNSYFEHAGRNHWYTQLTSTMSREELRQITLGRFNWNAWILHDNASFPDIRIRQEIAFLAEQWVKDRAISQWQWMRKMKVSPSQQHLLAQMVQISSGGGSTERYDSITQNPYLLAQISPDLIHGIAQSQADWWHWIDRLGQHQLGHTDYASLARHVGAVVMGMTWSQNRGHTQQMAVNPTSARSMSGNSWLYKISSLINPKKPQEGMEAAYEVIRLIARNELRKYLPVPYTWDHRGIEVAMPANSDDVAWLSWPGLAWMEYAIRDMVTGRISAPGSLPKGWDAVLGQCGIELSPSYQESLAVVWSRPLTILTGAAGTGKTTLIRALAILRNHYAPDDPLWLTATTAKAAQRIHEVLGQVISEQELPRTLHRLLAESGNWPNAVSGGLVNRVRNGWLVVDEASMADVWLLGRLAISLQGGQGHVVLVGDHHQLAPVGPGAPFDNLVRTFESLVTRGELWQDLSPVTTLTTVFRIQRDTVRANANALLGNKGVTTSFCWDNDGVEKNHGAFWIEGASPEERRKLAVLWAQQQEHDGTDWQIVTPRQKDAVAINAAISKIFSHVSELDAPFHIGDRIVQIVNDYVVGVVNGQQGKVIAIDPTTITAFFSPDTMVKVDWDYAQTHWIHSWALTVHKAQGSQWVAVALVWGAAENDHQNAEILGSSEPSDAANRQLLWGQWKVPRNLVYTAFTRAQNHFTFIAPSDPTPFLEELRAQPEEATTRKTRLITLVSKRVHENPRKFSPSPAGLVDDC